MDLYNLALPLRTHGFRVFDERVPPAPGPFTPIGIISHHTASAINFNPAPSLHAVKYGRGGANPVPGPLCNYLISRDANVYVITNGRANDSGSGDPNVLAHIRQGLFPLPVPQDRRGTPTVNNNPFYYDIEVENDGIGEPYSARVTEVAGRLNALLLTSALRTFDTRYCIRHRDLTRRKIDWSNPFLPSTLTAQYLPLKDTDTMIAAMQLVSTIYASHGRVFPDTEGLLYWADRLMQAETTGDLHLAAAINALHTALK